MSGQVEFVISVPLCTCGRTTSHTLSEHDQVITDRAEQAAGVPDTGELVAADEVLVVNLYRNGIGDSEALYAKVIARVPALANRVLFLDAESIAVVRLNAPVKVVEDDVVAHHIHRFISDGKTQVNCRFPGCAENGGADVAGYPERVEPGAAAAVVADSQEMTEDERGLWYEGRL